MSKIKLAVFDMEGTIFRNTYRGQKFPSIWKVLCYLCGPQAAEEDAAYTEKYLTGGYAGCYSAWVLDTLRILKKYGLKQNELETLINEIDYFPGVEETFTALRNQGMTIAVISGGLKALADRVAIDHYVDHCFAAAEFYWNPDGTIRHWNMQPTDFAHKRSVLEILCRDLGISGDECLFVGDGRNDRAVAGYCALSIGFNPHDELRKEVDVIIEQPEGREDLSAILEPLSKYPNFKLDDFSEYKVWKGGLAESINFSTLSTSGQRVAFHAFLMQNGLTHNSANSYCSYLNNLCKNIAEISWEGASAVGAFTVLERVAKTMKSEEAVVEALAKPLAGTNGRQNDTTSAVKQFYRFVKGGL
jgi:phosphoserine phosphatase